MMAQDISKTDTINNRLKNDKQKTSPQQTLHF